MPVKVPSGPSDDNDFVAMIQTIVTGFLKRHPAEQVWIIHIDNWFDHKWMGFSGNGAMANWMFAGSPSADQFAIRLDSVKIEFSQRNLTFPPFSPGRVLGQWSYLKSGEDYAEFPLPEIPHGTEKVRSGTNLHRRIADFSKAACFVWFSGNTIANDRGSLMVYSIHHSQTATWFAAFNRKNGWKLTRTKGVETETVQRLIGEGSCPSD